jgi:two-component system response regulator GlrR
MTDCRCIIWEDNSGRGATALAESLSRVGGIEPLALSGGRPLPRPISTDVVVCVARSGSLDAVLERVGTVRAEIPGCPVIVAGDHLSFEDIAALMAAGVNDFVSISSTYGEFAARVLRAARQIPASKRVHECPEEQRSLGDFIGTSPAFVQQVARLRTIARCDVGVLILGETGTGKEIFAQAIHYLSARASKPCVALNCGAIPLDLIESELFGHVKGAYTTAHASRPGLAREAEGGTLFLDDVDCLPLVAQAKLLRFLQEREFRPVGSSTVHHADVRVVAASNRQLGEMAARGEFRQDLYFRLNVLSLNLPPLRERQGDIPLLANYFRERFSCEYERGDLELTAPSLSKLVAYNWPGNVRELQHVVERAVVLTTGTAIGPDTIELPVAIGGLENAESFRAAKERVVESFERSFVERLLVAHRGNVTHAAHAAGKNRRAFFELMRKHRIEAAGYRTPPLQS